MSMLEHLGISTQGLIKESHPFESWNGSKVKNWPVTMRLLTMGDLIDITKLTASAGPVEAAYTSKVYLLAKSLMNINHQPIVTEEDIEKYNKEHDLSGTQKIDIFGYKVLFIRKLTEPVVNRLAYLYDEMQDKYLSEQLGRVLPPELRAAVVSGIDFSDIAPPNEETSDDTADGDTTIT